jgi:hypothetical protein
MNASVSEPIPLIQTKLHRTPVLEYSPDSSLPIYLQYESPGADKEDNWLQRRIVHSP